MKWRRPVLWLAAAAGVAALTWCWLHPAVAPRNVSQKFPATRESRLLPSSPPASASTTASDARRRDSSARLGYAQGWEAPLPAPLAEFRDWTQRYLAAGARAALEAEGIALARIRRPAMLELIKTDPARALAVTVPAAVHAQLPPSVRAELETRVAGTGDLALLCAYTPGANGRQATERVAVLGGVTYTAHVYGRRAAQLTKYAASLHGIALEGQIAVHERPLRLFEAGETPPATATDPFDGSTLATPAAWVEVHGRIWALADDEALTSLETRLAAAEEVGGPRVAPLLLNGLATGELPRAAAANEWSTGTKKVLVIRADFPDRPGDPMAETSALTVMNQCNAEFFVPSSYGKTSLTTTVTSKTYRLPQTITAYAAQGAYQLHQDAVDAAARDYNTADYDRLIVVYHSERYLFGYAGQAEITGKRIWIENSWDFNVGVLAHELGHSYGLLHANYWQVSDGNPVSPSGRSIEYGDVFDLMGAYHLEVADSRYDFNMWEKNRLGWFSDGAVQTITTSGTYRVYRFDTAAVASNQPLALRIFRDGVRTYWIGLRQRIPNNAKVANGAYVIWGFNSLSTTQLLNLDTPGSDGNYAALPVGSSFTDSTYGITIKPIARGGSEPAQYLDLAITVSAAPSGVIASWGASTYTPPELTGVSAFAADGYRVLALKTDGSLLAWDYRGTLPVPGGLGAIRTVAAGGGVCGVVKQDGTIQLWSDSPNAAATPPSGLTDVRQLAIGGALEAHAVALRVDGTVACWGSNRYGQTTVPAGLRDVLAVAAGDGFTVALRADGTLTRWGLGFSGLAIPFPANVADVVALASNAGSRHVLALKSDGTVLAWGSDSNGQCDVPIRLANVVAVATGVDHSLALKADGTVVAWGSNLAGQLDVPSLPRAVAIAGGSYISYALLGAGALITAQPKSQALVPGASTTLSVGVSAPGAVTYQWRKDGVAIAGATNATLELTALTVSAGGFYDVVVSSNGSSTISQPARVSVSSPIFITSSPTSQTLQPGLSTTLAVESTGGGTITYQWRKDGAPIAGATSRTFTLGNVTFSTAGVYDVVLTDGATTVRSAAATLTVVPVPRIANLSVLTSLGAGETFTAGFVVGPGALPPNGSKALLFRAVGPSLGAFGVAGAMPDPKLQVALNPTLTIENDNWGGSQPLRTVMDQVGAFPLTSNLDAALQEFFQPGAYSVRISGFGNSAGTVLAEIYDSSPAPFFTAATLRLVNVSVLKHIGAGLTAGFVIAGATPVKVLVRAIGPTLGAAPFGVAGAVADPLLTLFNDKSVSLGTNNDWGGTAELINAFASAGAFTLGTSSKDAAIIATLPPGGYTVQVTGVGGTTGIALVEIYQLP